jgi:hypothetical protein
MLHLTTVNVAEEIVEGLWTVKRIRQYRLLMPLGVGTTIYVAPGGQFEGDVYFVYPEDRSFIGANDIDAIVVVPKAITEVLEIHWIDKYPPTSPEEGFMLMNIYRSKEHLLGSSNSAGSGVIEEFVGDDGVEYNKWKIHLTGLAFVPEGPHILALVRQVGLDELGFQTLAHIRVRLEYEYVPPEQPTPQPQPQSQLSFVIPNVYDFFAGYGISGIITALLTVRRKQGRRR